MSRGFLDDIIWTWIFMGFALVGGMIFGAVFMAEALISTRDRVRVEDKVKIERCLEALQ